MKRENGFTLVEMMVTLAVGAVLLTVAVPAFNTMIRDNRLVSQANELVAALNFTRSEAIKRGVLVTVCSSADPTAVTPTCGGGGVSWDNGWVVFVDNLATGTTGTLDAGEEILNRQDAAAGGNTINSPESSVTYTGSGMPTGLGATYSNGTTFKLCDDRGVSEAHTVNIGITGRVESGDVDVDGAALTNCN